MLPAGTFLAQSLSRLQRTIDARQGVAGPRRGRPRLADYLAPPHPCPFDGLSDAEQEFFDRCAVDEAVLALEGE